MERSGSPSWLSKKGSSNNSYHALDDIIGLHYAWNARMKSMVDGDSGLMVKRIIN